VPPFKRFHVGSNPTGRTTFRLYGPMDGHRSSKPFYAGSSPAGGATFDGVSHNGSAASFEVAM